MVQKQYIDCYSLAVCTDALGVTVSVNRKHRVVGSSRSLAQPAADRVDPAVAGAQPIPATGPATGRAEALALRFAERVKAQQLPPGARLPSVRQCARLHGVSPTTVVAAYDRLQAQGLIEARRQRGYFVRANARWPLVSADLGGGELGAAAPQLAPPVDAHALIRGMFQQADRPPGPGMGTLPEAWLDAPLLQRALRHALRDVDACLRYGDPAGEPHFRAVLAHQLNRLGIVAAPAQIVTSVGATHALDIIARTLLRAGDTVLVDEPGWAVEFARLSHMGMRLLPVPRGADGPDLNVMARLLQVQRPRLYVTVSVLHNPTGNSLSLASAHQILKLAEAHDLQIVEDDTYAWLGTGHEPRLAALDGLQRTIYVSGFSKILAPDWRVGYLAAPPAIAKRCVDTKLLMTLTAPSLFERALTWLLEQGLLRRHAERVTTQLEAARTRVVKLARESGCEFVAPPQGLFGWCDTHVDTAALAALLAEDNWLVAPGHLFLAAPQTSRLMRVNFATAQDAKFWRALVRGRATLMQRG